MGETQVKLMEDFMGDWIEQKSRMWALELGGPKFKLWLCRLQAAG